MRSPFVRLVQFSLALASLTVALSAQTPPPQPGPEHEKLGYWVGTWSGEQEQKASPFGPGGKTTSTATCEWFEGKFVVLCHSQGTGPNGPFKGISFIGYSNEEKVYLFHGAENTGMVMSIVPRGTVQGDTWTYTAEGMVAGQKMKSRMVMKVQSPTAYTYTWETQGPDGKWNTVTVGKSRKTT